MLTHIKNNEINQMIINYKGNVSNFVDYLKSIMADLFLLIFSLVTIEGIKYISIKDSGIILSFIIVFTSLQLINIRVNMNSDRPVLNKLTNQITNINRSIGFVPIVFIIFGIPTGIYPVFFGAFVFSNLFNIFMHLDMKKAKFQQISTIVDSNKIIIRTKAKLMLQSGNWEEQINCPQIRFRVVEFNYRFGFITPIFYNRETYQKLKERPKKNVKDKEYHLHFLNSSKPGIEIKIDKEDKIHFIGKTQNFTDISNIIDELKPIISTQYCLFVNN